MDQERVAAHLPARELPMNCFQDMGIRLSSNVEELAYLLNVDNDTLIKLKTKDNPAREVLEYWANKPDTTALVLRMILQKLKRYDVIRILDKYIKDEVDVVLVVITKASTVTLTLRLPSTTKLKEKIPEIPELAGVDLSKIKCKMESASEDILDAPAKDLKGKQVTLTTVEPRVTSEPVSRMQADRQPGVNHRSLPSSSMQTSSANECPGSEETDDSSSTTFKVHLWPRLSEYEISKLLAPRLSQAGTYLLRRSNADDEALSITVINNDRKLTNFRIWGSDKKHTDVYLFEDKERFHNVNELLDYYANHQIVTGDGEEGPVLKKAL